VPVDSVSKGKYLEARERYVPGDADLAVAVAIGELVPGGNAEVKVVLIATRAGVVNTVWAHRQLLCSGSSSGTKTYVTTTEFPFPPTELSPLGPVFVRTILRPQYEEGLWFFIQ
jgi:hypothetical protein